ncbi:choice-of-anchor Q domain-containing protein [Dyadobacter aurulentus]|uniref:choice-of-anchor Q domain-containing protein n=1 Tax=Dyadobacter sp. UC 10 TaxID=2605428 RepID=UPI0011F0E856|nr:choice-of-anchor Q domain-containing protein [Dyadobacter sp. UC 10]KAA0991953.1 T9SS type A sorting domain-containing protein [Dyadobacter sp. UC 10]
MNRQNFTLTILCIVLPLLTVTRSAAQINAGSTKNQKLQSLIKRGEISMETMNKWVEKPGARHTIAASNQPGTHSKLAAFTGPTRQAKPPRAMQRNRTRPDTVAKTWLKKAILATGKRTPAARPHSSTARKSATTAVPPTLYVNYLAEGTGEGDTWGNAFTELSDALAYAKNNAGVEQIWVANGIYHPLYDHNYTDEGPDPRDKAFIMLPDVKIYGGFAGNETSVNERDLNMSAGSELGIGGDIVTILSGDFNDDDFSDNNTNENAYHVVISAGNLGSASLDGFVIVGGNANSPTSITVNEEEIFGNSGGGIAAFNSSPSLSNLLISYNAAGLGSAFYGFESDFVMTNALIGINYALGRGTVYADNSSPVITNATITSNTADGTCAGVVLTGAGTAAAIRNSIIYGNYAADITEVSFEEGANASFAYSIVAGSGGSSAWNAGFGTDGGNNLDTDPLFHYGFPGLRPGSPAVNTGNNLYFQAGQSPELSALTTDQRGTVRITGDAVDIGALESLYGNLSSVLTPNSDGVLFVKKGGAGSGNGDSWDNAAPEVADALFAGQFKPEIFEIWVAGGTYLPLYRPDNLSNADPKDQANTFLMVDGISLYGGFAGTETTREERNPGLTANASILSGDFEENDNFNFTEILDNEDFDPGYEDNANRLITMVALQDFGVALNGFKIEGAQNLFGNPEETILVSETEVPAGFGAGILVMDSDALIENVVLRKNIGILGGGMMAFNAYVTITNSLIYHNIDAGAGSGIAIFGSFYPSVFLNTTITQNLSLSSGPAVGMIASETWIANSIVYDNIITEDSSPEGEISPLSNFMALGSIAFFSNSIVGGSGGSYDWKLHDYENGSDIHDGGRNLDEDPGFSDIGNEDFSLTLCSPAIDAGDADYYLPGTLPVKDLAGNNRIFNGSMDMGALEFQGVRPADVTALAADGNTSSYLFDNSYPHTFSTDGAVCDSDLLTLIPTSLTGTVNARVWVDTQVQTFNDAVYLQRHFDIVPEDDAESATGRVVLYFTQEEFTALNMQLTSSAYLPTGDPDGEEDRKGNLRIYQFHGPSEDESGNPSSYGGSRRVIDPDDNDIQWNTGQNRWEVTFDVDGFSGFFAGTATQNPLPVRLISFEGKHTDDQKVRLDWKVTEQENIGTYQVEYSENGKSFNKIGHVMANTLASTDYSFTDSHTRFGHRAYYRLKVLELDGKTAYSKIVSVKLPEINGMIAYPIPAKNELWIDWQKTNAASVDFVDLTGRIIKTVKKSANSQKIDISGFSPGVFLLKAEGNNVLKVIKN